MRRFLLCISVFILFASPSLLLGQYDSLDGRFLHYDVESGLKTSSIRSVTQDAIGFMWIGTQDGLYRYDGHKFLEIENPYSDAGYFGRVKRLKYSTETHEVFIGSVSGFYSYNISTDSLVKISELDVSDLYFHEGMDKMLIGGREGSYKLASYKLKSKSYQVLSDSLERLPLSIFPLDDQFSEILYGNWKVYRHNTLTKDSRQLILPPPIPDDEGGLVQDIERQGDKIYIGTWAAGLMVFDLELNYIKTHYIFPEKLTRNFNVFRDLVPRQDSLLYVSTADRGIGYFNTHSEKFSFYIHDSKDPSSITSISGRQVFFDHQSNLWGAMAESLSLLASEQNIFSSSVIRLDEGSSLRTVDHINVVGFRDSLIFQATKYLAKLVTFTIDGEQIESDFDYPTDHELSCSNILNFQDRYLIAYGEDYLYKVLPLSGLIESYSWSALSQEIVNNQPGSLLGARIDKDTLVCFTRNKIYWLEAKSLDLIRSEAFIKDQNIQGIVIQNNHLFVNTRDGLYKRLGVDNYQKMEEFSSEFYKKNGLLNPEVWGSDKIIFGSVQKGIVSFNTKTKEHKSIRRDLGTKSNSFSSVTSDDQENIWAISTSGLVFYNKNFNRAKVFSTHDGLIQTDLSGDKLKNIGNGKIVVALDEGINIVDINKVNLGESGDSIKIYSVNGQNPKDLKFPFDVGSINIYYSGFDYGATQDLQYEYSLNNSDWNEIGSAGRLQLLSLTPGQYQVSLRAFDNLSRLVESNVLEFRINRPWYGRWWFYLIVASLLGFICYQIIRFAIKRKREKERIEAEYHKITTELENQVLRAQMNPHFLFNSLNSIRYFIVNQETEKAATYLTKFSRLIRMILEHSGQPKIALSSELEMVQLYVSLEQVRFNDKFDFEVKISDGLEIDKIQIPPLLIQPFLENSILHGLNGKDGKGQLCLTMNDDQDFIKISVSDDGIGRTRSSEIREQSSLKRRSMGMSITEKRLRLISEKYKSNITIEDLYPGKENVGTIVTLRIPKKDQ